MKSKLNSFALASIVAVISGGMMGCDRSDRARSEPETDRSAGRVLDDQTIATHVRSALNADSMKYPDVKVDTYNGVVQLSGFADTSEQKNRAGELAGKVDGVKKVDNNITLKSNNP